MPVSVHLSEDQSHLIYEFEEPLEIRELMEAYQQEKEYRNAVPHTVHSIVDMSRVRRIPPNWLVAKAGPGFTHPRSGRMVFVGISYGLRIVVKTILNIVRYGKMQFFETRDEAEQYMAALVQKTKSDDEAASSAS